MITLRKSGLSVSLALAGLLPVAPPARALDAQEYAGIQSQCQREAQDYGVEPEQIEEYVNGCVMAYGGTPAAAPEPETTVDAGAEDPAANAQDMNSTGDQDAGAVLE